MRILSTTALAPALAVALAIGGTALVAPAAAKEKAPKEQPANYSPKVREGAAAAQAAIAKGDFPTAQAALTAAEPEIKTPDDKYVIGALSLQIAQKTNDQTSLGKAINMMVESGKAPAAQTAQLQAVRGKLAYQAKDYQTAESAMLAAQQAGSTDPDLVPVLVESMHNNGKDLAALQLLNQQIDKAAAAGQQAPDTWFQRGVAIGYTNKSPADRAAINTAVTDLSRKWLATYPTKTHWRDSLLIYRDAYKIDAEQELDMLRLLRTAGALNGERDYMDYVMATYLKYPGEAKQVLDEAQAAGVGGSKNAVEIRGVVTPKIAADKASLASADKTARAAATGKQALGVADAYLGYGDYAKAIDLYKVALSKGGVDAATANTRLGIALTKSGDKAGAKAAFAQVSGPRKPLADFWSTYVDHPATA